MCGRATLTVTKDQLEARFDAFFFPEEFKDFRPVPHYNMAPSMRWPVITDADPSRIRLFRWGMEPYGAKTDFSGPLLINARRETVAEKPTFRDAFRRRRCLWPVDGYYEWIKNGKERIPYRVIMPEESVFSIAGIWDVREKEGKEIYSFTILTCAAEPSMEFLHPRMPVILPRHLENEWLDPDIDPQELLDYLSPPGQGALKIYRVSGKVNQVKNNSSGLIKEIPDVQQGTLF